MSSQDNPRFRGRVYDSILDTVGATPLVKLSRLAAAEGVKGLVAASKIRKAPRAPNV